jgi:hypothetical protein
MRYLILLTCYLFAHPISAQRFWLTTPGFPSGSKTCLAGTQDTILFVGVYGKGIWKTRNGGHSWHNTLPNHNSIFSLHVTSSKLVVAGGTGKIYFSNTLGETWDSVQIETPHPVTEIIEDQQGGLYAITRYEDAEVLPTGDGVFYTSGDVREWQKRNNGLPANSACDRIAIDRRGRLYLATTDYDATGQKGLFISDDGGQSWTHRSITVKSKTDASAYSVRPQFNYGITITPQDSVMFSFTGLGANFAVYLNVIKHIDDIDKDMPWKDPNGKGWAKTVRLPVHIAHNGDYYSSVDGTQSGGTLISKDQGQSWVLHTEGLGKTKTGFSTPQVFYETSYGLIYMIRYLDDLIYWTDESIVNPRRISGSVADVDGTPRMVEFNFHGHNLYRSGIDGTYSIVVPSGWSGTIKPYRRTYTFEPAELQVNNIQQDIGQNFISTYATVTHLLTGTVTDNNGTPMANVPLVGLPEYTETDDTGSFGIAVPAGWKGRVTPQSPQHQFSPAAYSVENLTADREMNFTALKRTSFRIEGTVHNTSGQPITGVTFNGFPENTTTDAAGNFFLEIQAGWTGALTPFKAGYVFAPAQIPVMPVAMDIKGLRISGNLDITGIPDEHDRFDIKPYPNPSGGDVTIDLPQPNKGFRLEVYTTTGQLIMQDRLDQSTANHQFRLTEKGLFIVKVIVGQKLHTAKLRVR